MLSKIGRRSGFALLLSAIVLTFPASGRSEGASTSVILSFDTEVSEDVEALRALNIQVPATYFFTGEFALDHPDVVARLAQDHTIGSHSHVHADLATLDRMDLRRDLLVSKRAIEEAAGRPVDWFRAPFLSYNQQVMEILEDLGFQYDSSDKENWTQDHPLIELPISADSETLTSDYDMFETAQMTDAQALEWLKATYRKRAELGRPMVWLLHPKTIAKHADVLHSFIDFVHQEGGVFQTAEQYVAGVEATNPKRWGVWVDFSDGEHDPQVIADDAARAGITDAFVMARDTRGNRYYQRNQDSRPRATQRDLFGETVRLLKAKGIRVHAWIPAFQDPYLAKTKPTWAMLTEDGQRSNRWVSPSRPEVQADLAQLADHLIKRYGVDGIHLDDLRYPSVLSDLSPANVAAFAADAGLEGVTADQIPSQHYSAWASWHADQIAKAAAEIRQAMTTSGHAGAELSAALLADAALSYRVMEMSGQDYTKLAGALDLIVPKAYIKEAGRPVSWIREIALITRYRIGDKPMLIGVEGYQKPSSWRHSSDEFDAVLQTARHGSDGIVVYPYLNLFRRGEAGSNMPAGSLAAFTLLSKGEGAQASLIDPRWAASAGTTQVTAYLTETIDGITDGAMTHLRSFPSRDPKQWAIVVFAIVGVGLVGAMFTARRRTRAITSGSARDAQLMLADEQAAKPSGKWPQLGHALGDGSYAACSALLRDLGPAGIERYRVIFMLDLLESSGGDLAPVLDELSGMQEWRRLALRYVEECNLQGYVELHGRNVSVTTTGMRELARARETGFSSVWWRVMETRIHETITVTCSRCSAHNPTHWFWPSIECFRCGTTLDIEQVEPKRLPQKAGEKLQVA